MASQVLSGTDSVSYTNNTGQNVRIVINYMASKTTMLSGGSQSFQLSISWSGGGTITNTTNAGVFSIGRNLAFIVNLNGGVSANNFSSPVYSSVSYPTELMLASGQSFSATCGGYNIVVIPEAG